MNCYGKYNSENVPKVECAGVFSRIKSLHDTEHKILRLLNKKYTVPSTFSAESLRRPSSSDSLEL